jgi:hypothetical protein
MPEGMSFIGWIVIGLLAGAIAGWFVPGRERNGCLGTMLIGIVGGLLADQHEPGVALPLAEHRLGRAAPQVACPAAGRSGAQRGQRRAGWGTGNALRKRHAEGGCRRDATAARKV